MIRPSPRTLIALITFWLIMMLFLPSYLLKDRIEDFATELFQSDVDVDSLSFDYFSGKITLHGVTLSNPFGFNAPDAVVIEKIDTTLDIGSLFSPKVTIQTVNVVNPTFYYETRGFKNNYLLLRQRYGSSWTAGTEGVSKRGTRQRITIDHLTITGATLHVRIETTKNNPPYTLEFPEKMEMMDIGYRFDLTFADAITDIILHIGYHSPIKFNQDELKAAIKAILHKFDTVPVVVRGRR